MQTNKFYEKASLFYGEDAFSPLFTIVAHKYIKSNNPTKAIEILENGIKNTPNYQTAYLLLFSAYQMLNSSEKASEIIENYKSTFGETNSFLLMKSVFEESKSLPFKDDEILRELNEEILPEFEESEGEEFYSESLANIYEAQNAFAEAIDVLEKMIIQEPERTDYFSDKIEKIKLRITKNGN